MSGSVMVIDRFVNIPTLGNNFRFLNLLLGYTTQNILHYVKYDLSTYRYFIFLDRL